MEKIIELLKSIPEDAECTYCILSHPNSKEYIVLLDNKEVSYLKDVFPVTYAERILVPIENISEFLKYDTYLIIILEWKSQKSPYSFCEDFYCFRKINEATYLYEAYITEE